MEAAKRPNLHPEEPLPFGTIHHYAEAGQEQDLNAIVKNDEQYGLHLGRLSACHTFGDFAIKNPHGTVYPVTVSVPRDMEDEKERMMKAEEEAEPESQNCH